MIFGQVKEVHKNFIRFPDACVSFYMSSFLLLSIKNGNFLHQFQQAYHLCHFHVLAGSKLHIYPGLFNDMQGNSKLPQAKRKRI